MTAFVWGLSSHSRMFTHIEMSPIPVKGCKCWPMLGTYGYWVVRIPWRVTPTVTRGIRLNGHLRGIQVTYTVRNIREKYKIKMFFTQFVKCQLKISWCNKNNFLYIKMYDLSVALNFNYLKLLNSAIVFFSSISRQYVKTPTHYNTYTEHQHLLWLL